MYEIDDTYGGLIFCADCGEPCKLVKLVWSNDEGTNKEIEFRSSCCLCDVLDEPKEIM